MHLARSAAMVHALAREGACVDSPDTLRRTPLMSAARCQHTDVALALVQAGADVRARDALGRTAKVHAMVDDILARPGYKPL
jgi:ankyrin repeat protein